MLPSTARSAPARHTGRAGSSDSSEHGDSDFSYTRSDPMRRGPAAHRGSRSGSNGEKSQIHLPHPQSVTLLGSWWRWIVILVTLCMLAPSLGYRVGEASNPGPDGAAGRANAGLTTLDCEFFDLQEEDDPSTVDALMGPDWYGPPPPSPVQCTDAGTVVPHTLASNFAPLASGEYSQWLTTITPEAEAGWGELETMLDVRTTSTVKTRQPKTGKLLAQQDFLPSATFQGRMPDWYFTTRDRGTGYYPLRPSRSASDEPPMVLSLASLIVDSNLDVPRPSLAKLPRHPPLGTAHHARRPDGRRRQCRGRKRIDHNSWVQPHKTAHSFGCSWKGTTLRGDSSWKEAGLWAMDTVNPNAWRAGKEYLQHTLADVVCMQETKMRDGDAIAAVEAAMRNKGWRACLSPADLTTAGRPTGGVAIACRAMVGMTTVATQETCSAAPYRHRLTATWLQGVVRGGIFILSIWLRDSEGLSPENLDILQQVAEVLSSLRGPWVIGGDWNINPQVLAASGWLGIVDGVIHSPEEPTCNSNTYDYFVVSKTFSGAVAGVLQIEDAGLQPHIPSRLLLYPAFRRQLVRRAIRPTRIPGALPAGPLPAPPVQLVVDTEAPSSQESINHMFSTVWTQARTEFAALTGHAVEKVESRSLTRFRWEPMLGNTARPPHATTLSHCWRVIANRVKTLARLSETGATSTSREKQLAKVWGAAKAFVQHKDARLSKNAMLLNFASWVQAHSRNGHTKQLAALATTAVCKANSMEQCEQQKEKTAWQRWLRGEPPSSSRNELSGLSRPTRRAFQYVRTPVGWSNAPMSTIEREDATPGDTTFPLPRDHVGTGGSAAELQVYDDIPPAESSNSEAPDVPLGTQAAAELEADQYALLWQEGASIPLPRYPDSLGAPPPELTAEDLRTAALTFPIGTGIGTENVSPRAFARLSSTTLANLALLLTICEREGMWPAQLALVLIILLPKLDGGRRPIGLFPSIVRLWMRARANAVRKWEQDNAIPEIYGGPAMGAHRAAWQAAFSAEWAGREGYAYSCTLLDLVKAFEMVDHNLVIAAAVRRGYCLWRLRLSLAAYRFARAIAVDNCYSRLVHALRGITAGSGTATTELRLIMTDVVQHIRAKAERFALGVRVGCFLYVDDLSIEAIGSSEQQVEIAASAASLDACTIIHKALRMKLSAKKSVVVASTSTLARRIAGRCRHRAITPKRFSALLGTGVSGGRRRCTKVLKARLGKFQSRVKRFQQARRAGVCAKQLVRVAGNPAAHYGVEIIGLAADHLHRARLASYKASAAEGGGKNLDLALYTADCDGGQLDPAYRACAGPIRAWATAWWDTWRPHQHLQQAWELADAKLRSAKQTWKAVTGPASAAIASAWRIGWVFLNGNTCITHDGTTLDLTRDPPCVVASAASTAVSRWRLARIVHAHPAAVRGMDLSHDNRMPQPPVDLAGVPLLPPSIVDMPQVITKFLYRASGSSCATCPQWNTACRPFLASAMSGGQWTQARLAQVRGWQADDLCQLCGSETGTTMHRYSCLATRPPAGWAPPPPAAEQFLLSLHSDRREFLMTHGILLMQLPELHKPSSSVTWIVPPEDGAVVGACWYTDGSLLDGQVAGSAALSTVGFGVLAVDDHNEIVAAGYGTPPSWISTIPGVEAWAIYIALQHSISARSITTDCLSVVKSSEHAATLAKAATCPLARTWALLASPLEDLQTPLVWSPAHLSLQEACTRTKSDGCYMTFRDWRANRLVDVLAKKGAGWHRRPRELRTQADAAMAAASHALVLLGVVTKCANHHQVTGHDGRVTVLRDSKPTPWHERYVSGRTVGTCITSKPLPAPRNDALTLLIPADRPSAPTAPSSKRPPLSAKEKRQRRAVYTGMTSHKRQAAQQLERQLRGLNLQPPVQSQIGASNCVSVTLRTSHSSCSSSSSSRPSTACRLTALADASVGKPSSANRLAALAERVRAKATAATGSTTGSAELGRSSFQGCVDGGTSIASASCCGPPPARRRRLYRKGPPDPVGMQCDPALRG